MTDENAPSANRTVAATAKISASAERTRTEIRASPSDVVSGSISQRSPTATSSCISGRGAARGAPPGHDRPHERNGEREHEHPEMQGEFVKRLSVPGLEVENSGVLKRLGFRR